MGKIQHKPVSGFTECAHLIGSEAIYFNSNITVNETSNSGRNQEILIRFYVGDKVGVSIIESISHFHTANALKRGKNQ